MKLIKKVVGIDIAKDSFKVCFGTLNNTLQQKISKAYSFSNDKKGFDKLIQTLKKIDLFKSIAEEDHNLPVWFVVEATGVYYENLAYFLADKNYSISVILPNKAKHFFKTLDNKSKTDNLDASALTLYGLEKQLRQWNIPVKIMKDLKELTREYLNLTEMTTQIKNKLHAKSHSYKPLKETVKRLNEQLKFYQRQIIQVKKQIDQLVKSNEELYNKIKKIITINGVGLMTVVTLISETNGFALIVNNKQLTSYAGYDIIQNESGQYFGKTRISKKGNKFIRNALYLPALCATRCNENLKIVYKRLCIKKISKKIAIIAIARKLLILIYTLWKKNEEFIPNYRTIKMT